MKENNICEYNKCTGCGLCIEFCPQKCISMKESNDGFLYPVINKEKCIKCGLCKKKCPNNKEFNKNESEMYMAIHKDKDILKRSSSGGAFTGIASTVLNDSGIVIGVHYDKEKDELKHIAINNEEDLDLLRLSKYYQSSMAGIYKETLNYLKEGKKGSF